jgi:hypothetical protein
MSQFHTRRTSQKKAGESIGIGNKRRKDLTKYKVSQ